MAYTNEQWLKAKGFFEAGYSLQQIEDETGITRSSISKRAKKESWIKFEIQQIKSDIVDLESEIQQVEEKKSILVEKVSNLEDYQINIIKELVEDTLKQKSILFNGLNLAMIRATQKLQANKKKEMLKIKEGFGAGISQERYEEIESDLSSSDIQDYTNTLIKAGQGLGLIEKDGASVNIQNNLQNNNIPLTLEDAEKEALRLGVPLDVLVK